MASTIAKLRRIGTDKEGRNLLPWFSSPWPDENDGETPIVQEAGSSLLETLFDLFFVSSLSTLSSSHPIIQFDDFKAFGRLFGVVWATYLHITIFDVQFARDSMFERLCKLIQMALFVFQCAAEIRSSNSYANQVYHDEDDRQQAYQIMCATIALSRALLIIQHSVILISALKKGVKAPRTKKLLFANIGWLFLSLIASVALACTNQTQRHIFLGIWILSSIDVVVGLAVNVQWGYLGFQEAHFIERMRTSTIIFIGEGAISVAKASSWVIPTQGINKDNSIAALGGVFILFLVFVLYVSNIPDGGIFGGKGKLTKVRLGIFSALHYFVHLSILGIGESVRQFSQGPALIHINEELMGMVYDRCVTQHLSWHQMSEWLLEQSFHYGITTSPFWTFAYRHITSLAYHAETPNCAPANGTLLGDPLIWDSYGEPIGTTMSMMYLAMVGNAGITTSLADFGKFGSLFPTAFDYGWGSLFTFLACMAGLILATHWKRTDKSYYAFVIMAVAGSISALGIGITGWTHNVKGFKSDLLNTGHDLLAIVIILLGVVVGSSIIGHLLDIFTGKPSNSNNLEAPLVSTEYENFHMKNFGGYEETERPYQNTQNSFH